jgi:hypothetical protein
MCLFLTEESRYACSTSLENAIVAAGREARLRDCVFHDPFAFCRQHAVLPNQARAHLSIRVDVLIEEASQLDVARGQERETELSPMTPRLGRPQDERVGAAKVRLAITRLAAGGAVWILSHGVSHRRE